MPESGDIIWLWSRPHSKFANARHDSVGRPDNWELVSRLSPSMPTLRASDMVLTKTNFLFPVQTDDLFWVVTLTCSPYPTILRLSTGASDPRPSIYQIPPSYNRHDGSQQPARRLSKFSHRLTIGGGARAELFRDGRPVVACDPGPSFKFEKHPETYNFNAVVFSSLTHNC